MKYAALITARSESKGLKDKNIRSLGGFPLLAWSVMACKKSDLIEEVYISTDSKSYADIAVNFGAKVPFIRPENLATDTSTDFDVFVHASNFFFENSIKIDNFVHIRPTTPLRDSNLIDKAISFFDQNKDQITSLRSVHEMSESAYKSFEIDTSGNLKLFGDVSSFDSSNLPRQRFPKTYSANGYIDIVKIDSILSAKSLHGNKIYGYITPIVSEVDNAEDFEYIEWQVQKDPTILNKLFGEFEHGKI
jgi:CMP-N-acetylneuraminic acid synthetase